MLISSAPHNPTKSPRLGTPTTNFASGGITPRTISNVPVLTGDVLVIGWGKINLTVTPANMKFWQGTSSAGVLGTLIMQNGPWGTTQRASTIAFYWRGLALNTAASFYSETYGATSGTQAQLYTDCSWAFFDVHSWGGGVGTNFGTAQNTAAGSSVSASITPTKNNSLLVGAVGWENNLAGQIALNAGWDRQADLTTGTGGDTVDAAVTFFSRSNADTGAKSLSATTAGSISAGGGGAGILELY